MKLSSYQVQPIMLRIPDTEKWRKRAEEGKQHFNEQGITDIDIVDGIYGEGFGIEGTHLYEYDNPGGGHKIGTANTALCLSMYMVYNIMLRNKEYDYFLFLEDDSRFKEGWRKIVEDALTDIPKDFDFLFVGSCCAEGKMGRKRVGRNLYHYPTVIGEYNNYPLCGNAYIIAKKCLPHILKTQRDAYVNADINLAVNSFPEMNVYAILPRPVEQNNNEHLPQ